MSQVLIYCKQRFTDSNALSAEIGSLTPHESIAYQTHNISVLINITAVPDLICNQNLVFINKSHPKKGKMIELPGTHCLSVRGFIN